MVATRDTSVRVDATTMKDFVQNRDAPVAVDCPLAPIDQDDGDCRRTALVQRLRV